MSILKRIIPLLQFTAGQRTHILERMRQVAVERDLDEMLPLLDRAIAHERDAQYLENRWGGKTVRARYADELIEVDGIVDQLLAGIRDIARGHALGLPAHHPVAMMCDGFLAELFPNGLAAVTSLPYIDQVLAVEVMLRRLDDDLADAVRRLGLEENRERLRERTAEYRRLVNEGRRDVRFAEVREARRRGQELLRAVIAMAIGRFPDIDDPAQVEARDALLQPLLLQLDQTRERGRRRRRKGTGADPETADPTSEPASGARDDAPGEDDNPVPDDIIDELIDAADRLTESSDIPATR